MDINDLDLDINNYNMKDLETFFHILPNQNYSASDIEEKEYTMRTLLLSSGEVDKKQQKDLIEFLNLAKDWLIFVKCNKKSSTNDLFDNKPNTRTNELTKRKETVYLNTQPDEAFPGIMNPLNKRVITKCLNIDTRFRDNYNNSKSSDFILHLPTKLNKVISMNLASFELPINFYGISEHLDNNYLNLSVVHVENFQTYNGPNVDEEGFDDSVLTTSNKTIIIPDGNYDAADLILKINTLLGNTDVDVTNLEESNIDDVFKFINFNVDIIGANSGTAKVSITPTFFYSFFIKSINLDFTLNKNREIDKSIPYTYRIGRNLGFNKPSYSNREIIADTIIEPSTIRYLYLIVDDFNNNVNNHFIGAFNKSLMSSNILARISVRGTYFSLLMNDEYSLISEPRKYFGPVDIQKLHIRLTDENGRIINMNNSDFSFCLNLRLLYDI